MRSATPPAPPSQCWGKGEYIGSAVNIIMCNSIAWPMFAGRYGLAPTERRTSGPIAGEGSLAYTDQGGESIGFGGAYAGRAAPPQRVAAVSNRVRVRIMRAITQVRASS